MPEIVKSNPVNEATKKPVSTHSKFTPNYSLFATNQFGLYSPFFTMEGLADDDISLRTNIESDTYTLKAPVMQPLKRNVDYFQVPFRAILPNTAELLITNPRRGDDVIATDVNAVIYKGAFVSAMNRLVSAFNKSVTTELTSLGAVFANFFRLIQFGNLFFSKGNVLNMCGINFHDFFRFTVSGSTIEYDFDDLTDLVFDWLKSHYKGSIDVTFLGLATYRSDSGSSDGSSGYKVIEVKNIRFYSDSRYGPSYHQLLEYLLDGYLVNRVIFNSSDFVDYTLGDSLMFPNGNTDPDSLTTGAINFQTFSADFSSDSESSFVNILKPIAYQIACAEFFTVDTVDDVFTARLWHQNLNSIFRSRSDLPPSFKYNGVFVPYDVVSGRYISDTFSWITTSLTNTSTNDGRIVNPSSSATTRSSGPVVAYFYWHNILGFNRSLRYQDYFVGSRTRPLAVGDVSVGVDTGSNTVDVVDISRNIMVQRFLNQVNRVGRKFSEYVKGILGDKPMPDAHDPIFLGHVVDTLGAEETENTADAQYSTPSGITSKFRGNSNRYAFNVHVGEPSILVGIVSYDIGRVYASVTDRENFHTDRYEFFNPYMQFVGDQAVYLAELAPRITNPSDAFGYQIRYAEYRQRVDRATGGFVKNLPGYAAIVDPSRHTTIFGGQLRLNSDFIRSHITDIDQFYLSLTGSSLSSYFHFINRFDMEITARRPMAFAPSIL